MVRKHVLVIVMPAFGHYIPGLELAKKIAPYHDVTVCVSRNKIPEVQQRDILPPAPIQLYGVDDKFTFSLEEHIHEVYESNAAIMSLDVEYEKFINALPTPDQPQPNDLGLAPVSAIFVDVTFPASIAYAHARGIPAYGFSPFAASLLAHFAMIDENTPTIAPEAFLDGSNTDLTKLAVPEFMKEQAIKNCKTLGKATAMLFNSFHDLEPTALTIFDQNPKFAHVPKKFIGPMLPTDEHLDKKKNQLEHQVLEWMDTKDPGSVVYFSFGTVAVPQPEQIVQVAEALVALKRPFIWALRPFLQEHLPAQYKVSTADNFDPSAPYLIVPWAPQKRVLQHPSAGVFVSHCGWNSTLEAVSYGMPVVGWPMFADQHLNAIMLEQAGAAVMLKGTAVIGRVVPKEEIVDVVETVGGWKGSDGINQFRDTMQQLAQKVRGTTAPDGLSTMNFLSVVNQI